MKDQKTKTASKPFSIIITAAQFKPLILAGKDGRNLYPSGNKSIPPIQTQKVGKDRIKIRTGDSSVTATISVPEGDPLAGDKVMYVLGRDGKAKLYLFEAFTSHNPVLQRIYTIISRTCSVITTNCVIEDDGVISLDGSKYQRFGSEYERLNRSNQTIKAGKLIVLYYFTKRQKLHITQISVRSNCDSDAVDEFEKEMEQFNASPTKAFDHLHQKAKETVKSEETATPLPTTQPVRPGKEKPSKTSAEASRMEFTLEDEFSFNGPVRKNAHGIRMLGPTRRERRSYQACAE